ncbi:PAS domain-containing methyl-accepting chemotaxis protein [Crenobacter sp. SG2303]|uniref:PAS domain-containing methyl-accepting chemotaxis protein n=1 Tax=Crenobacter oryzisoli TaxID=3056844 RepID=A0ABT7XS35_9NEIS|nr:PAS domain-containing methyl-accepting chemotaxis protein [Crenobacter sp. SG2303]MDN0076608.1 PAS domain-containing methyl-accepting chemotaxis protein [Crenobacter sp. SG2303]
MRNNQPVTGVETLLPEGQFIYSRTDLHGIIIEANEAFANISDYRREEMLGKPHSIVRHPDMPPQAFQDMWQNLKVGRPWRGLVKNRRRDGGYYWVVANASPVREHGQVVGYQSVRSRPSRDEVEAVAAVYQRIKNGDTSVRIEHGRVVPARRPLFTVFSGLGPQSLLIGLMVLLLSGGVLAGSVLPMAQVLPVLQVLAALSTVLALFFLLYSLPRLRSDLSATSDYLEHLLISGDLKKRFGLGRQDQLGEIVHKIDRFVSSIQATVQGIGDTVCQVQQVAHEVHRGVLKVNEAARVQSEATSSAAAGIEQITVANGEVATYAASTRDSAGLAAELSAQGAELSEQACSSILSLANAVKTSAVQVGQLGEKSKEISRITGVIKEIADQTNLLALNAAIEAARAGEAGRGFAVVADEVRKLAERTGKATQEISVMIQSVQEETSKAVSGMSSGAVQVESGVLLVQDSQNSLREINTQMANTMAMVSDIFHSSQEQQQALSQMAPNMERIASMTEQNLTVVNQTNATVNSLNDMVVRMQKCVAQFSA